MGVLIGKRGLNQHFILKDLGLIVQILSGACSHSRTRNDPVFGINHGNTCNYEADNGGISLNLGNFLIHKVSKL